jgi:hypothetical protein
MLRQIKNKTLTNLLNFIKKIDLELIKIDTELSNISKSFLEEYGKTIDLDNYKNTDELIKYVEDVILEYENNEIVYEVYEKENFDESFEILDSEWMKICHYLKGIKLSDTEDVINMYLYEGDFRDE